jgi:hypothetical protein
MPVFCPISYLQAAINIMHYLRALVVRAVGLRLPEEREQPAHGHLVTEDALAGVETSVAVRHLEAVALLLFTKKVPLTPDDVEQVVLAS